MVHRRFSDFDWLHSKLQSVEKYKGCVFPPLPGKKLLGKNSEQLVERRKEELQIYLQLLSRHTLAKYDHTLKFFLTCENSEEFERFKSDPREFASTRSIAVATMRNLQFKDTLNYIYSSLKARLVENAEPEETKCDLHLDEIDLRIAHYLKFLEQNVGLISARLAFQKQCLEEHKSLAKTLEETQDEDAELERTLRSVAEFHRKEASYLKVRYMISLRE